MNNVSKESADDGKDGDPSAPAAQELGADKSVTAPAAVDPPPEEKASSAQQPAEEGGTTKGKVIEEPAAAAEVTEEKKEPGERDTSTVVDDAAASKPAVDSTPDAAPEGAVVEVQVPSEKQAEEISDDRPAKEEQPQANAMELEPPAVPELSARYSFQQLIVEFCGSSISAGRACFALAFGMHKHVEQIARCGYMYQRAITNGGKSCLSRREAENETASKTEAPAAVPMEHEKETATEVEAEAPASEPAATPAAPTPAVPTPAPVLDAAEEEVDYEADDVDMAPATQSDTATATKQRAEVSFSINASKESRPEVLDFA